MKLILNESLPQGVSHHIQRSNMSQAPVYIQKLMAIEGVQGVYQVNDFMALERHPKADWKQILHDVRQVLGQQDEDIQDEGTTTATSMETDVSEGEFTGIEVALQMFRGIPMQIRLKKNEEESRVRLPERFLQAAMQAESASANLVMERKWVEQGNRYGQMDEIGEQLVQEISAAYDQERLDHLIDLAFTEKSEEDATESLNLDEAMRRMEDSDWKKRFAILERLPINESVLPILRKAIADEKMSVRRLATAYLGDIGGYDALQALYEAMKDRSPAVRRTAGDALSDIGDPDAIPIMLKALQDKNKLVRWRAARFMFEVGDKSTVEGLRKAEDDEEFEVSLQIKIALERIEQGHEAQGTVWQQMTKRQN